MRCTYDFTCTGETFGILKKHNRNKKEEEDQLFEFFPLQVDENGVVIEDEEPGEEDFEVSEVQETEMGLMDDYMTPEAAYLAKLEGNQIGVYRTFGVYDWEALNILWEKRVTIYKKNLFSPKQEKRINVNWG